MWSAGFTAAHGSIALTVLRLACSAMAQFGVQWGVSAELELDPATVTIAFVLCIKMVVWLMDRVWRSLLPLIDSISRLLLCHVLVHFE